MGTLSRFRTEPYPDELPSWQDVYAMVTTRASMALRTAAIVVVVVAALWGIGAILVLVVGIVVMRNYIRHHRMPGVIVRYQQQGDWAVVRLDDGTEVAARSPIVNLPIGSDVLLSVRRDGAYVISPAVWEGTPAQEESHIEVVTE